MKINIVTGFFLPVPPVQGGATEKIWFSLSKYLAARGHQVTFYSRAWPSFPHREVIDGVIHVRLEGNNHTRSLPLNLLLDLIWSVKVLTTLEGADVTICNCVALPILLAWFRRKPGRGVAVVARMPKGQARFYGRVPLMLSLSAAVTDRLRKENPAIAGRIRPFPFPIDWKRQANEQRTGTSVISIGYVGRLHPEKGLAILLEAASILSVESHPSWRLDLTGPVSVPSGGGGEAWFDGLLGRYRDALGPRLEVHPPEFDPAQLAKRYAQLDIFVYPSVAEKGETFGVAVAEAMAASAVPIVSALDCFNDLVIDGETGFVFDHRSPQAARLLATRIAELIDHPEKRAAYGQRARAWAQKFDFDSVGDALLRDLSAIVATASDGPLDR